MTVVVDDQVVTPDLRTTARRWRGPAVLVVVVLVASVLLALAQGSRARGLLDPDAVDPSGSGAAAALLEGQGVDVVRVSSADAAVRALDDAPGDATLLVAPTAPVSDAMLERVTRGPIAQVVLVGATDPAEIAAFAPSASVSGSSGTTDEVPPGCTWDIAQRTGPLPPTGPLYATTRADAQACWGGAVLDLPADGSEDATTLLGPAQALTNARLADSGHAALALNVLGRHATLVWWLPSLTDPLQLPPDSSGATVSDLVPRWVPLALAQVAVALLVAVWWRARRLGRVVVEPLPVVVRATEAVEGRARLYRRAGARGRAADVLRESAAARLGTLLRLPRGSGLDQLVPAVAARTGRDPQSVVALLSPGTDPTDDASLTRLADALDTLEDEVRRS